MDSNTADSHLPKSKQGRGGGLHPPPADSRMSFWEEVQRTTVIIIRCCANECKAIDVCIAEMFSFVLRFATSVCTLRCWKYRRAAKSLMRKCKYVLTIRIRSSWSASFLFLCAYVLVRGDVDALMVEVWLRILPESWRACIDIKLQRFLNLRYWSTGGGT